MAYIGKQPSAGDFTVLDDLTASATATYTLQKNSVNFVPGSANQLIVSLNGVIQEPGTSFTLNGSSLVFSSALTSADSIDFILALGGVGNFNTPSDDSITTAKIATDAVTSAKIADDAITSALIDDNAVVTAAINGNAVTAAKFNADVISGQTELAAEPADTDEFLVSDAGVLKRIDYSLIKGGGVVLQANSAFKATKSTTSSTSDVLVTGLEVSLTPAATSSKVLIMADLGGTSTSLENRQQYFSFYRDIGSAGYAAVGIGTGSTRNFGFGFNFGSISSPQDNYHPVSGQFLDSPNTTSLVTYQVRARIFQHPDLSGSPVGAVNGRASDSSFGPSSSITILEIGA